MQLDKNIHLLFCHSANRFLQLLTTLWFDNANKYILNYTGKIWIIMDLLFSLTKNEQLSLH